MTGGSPPASGRMTLRQFLGWGAAFLIIVVLIVLFFLFGGQVRPTLGGG